MRLLLEDLGLDFRSEVIGARASPEIVAQTPRHPNSEATRESQHRSVSFIRAASEDPILCYSRADTATDVSRRNLEVLHSS